MNTLRSGPAACSSPCFPSRSPGEQARGLPGPHSGGDTGTAELQVARMDQDMVRCDCLLCRLGLRTLACSEEWSSFSLFRRPTGVMLGVGSRVDLSEEVVSGMSVSP